MSEVPISKRLVAINSVSSLVAKAVNVTVLLWMYQYLLKRIPVDEFAILPVIMSIMVFAPLFFSFFTGGLVRYIVDAYAVGNKGRVTEIVSSSAPLIFASSVVFFTVGLAVAAFPELIFNFPAYMKRDVSVMIMLLVTSFCLQMIAVPFIAGFHVRQRFVELNLWGLARDFLRIVLLLTLLLGVGPGVIWVTVATAISEIAHTAITVKRSRQMVPELALSLKVFDWKWALELTNFGLWTTLGRLGAVMYTNAATIFLNLYGTATDVTSYHIGATFFRQIEITVGLALQPLQPVLTAMNALEEKARIRRTVFRAGRYALWATLFFAIPLVIFSSEFVLLYLGEEFAQTSMVIVLFMLIYPFTGPTAVLAMTAMSMARVREFFLPAFLFQFLGLVSMLAILNYTEMGAIGVTLALTTITVGSQLLYFWPLCLKLTGARFGEFVSQVLVPGLAPALGGVTVCVVLKYLVPASSWGLLLADCILGSLGFLLTLIAFGLGRDERALLHRYSGGLLGRS